MRRHPLVAVAGLAAIARVAFVAVSFVVNDVSLVPDEQLYIELARAVASGQGANEWYPDYGEALLRYTFPFSGPLVALFWLFAPVRFIAQMWAAVWGIGTVVVAVRLARTLVGERAAIAAGVLLALLPSQVLWSSVVLRESLVWFLLAAMALVLARIGERSVRRLTCDIALLFGLLLALTFLRSQTAVVAAFALLIAAWVVPGGSARVARAGAITLVAVVVPAIGNLGPLGLGLVRSSSSSLAQTRAHLGFDSESALTSTPIYTGDTGDVDCDSLTSTSDTLPGAAGIAERQTFTVETEDGRTIKLVCSPDGPVEVTTDVSTNLRELPAGFAATMLRPFPWERFDSVESKLAAFENVLWYCAYALAAVGLWLLRGRYAALAFPVLVAGGLLASSMLTQGNIGTAFRHRAQIGWVLAVLAAAGVEHLQERRRAARAASSSR